MTSHESITQIGRLATRRGISPILLFVHVLGKFNQVRGNLKRSAQKNGIAKKQTRRTDDPRPFSELLLIDYRVGRQGSKRMRRRVCLQENEAKLVIH